MCGIIGYLGNKPAQPILLTGLKRMEYRGYDSAGVATLGARGITLVRASGKVSELGKKLNQHKTTDHIGIGHTRWATHGEPSVKNAHPHRAGPLAIAHNGIIENYQELREELAADDISFASDTDTEVLAQLINREYQRTRHLQAAVESALDRVRGTFGIAVLNEDEPKQLIAARRGSPLIVGRKNGDVFIASDATALIGKAKEVIYLEDNEIAVLTPGNIEVFDLKRTPHKHTPEELKLELATIQKKGYDHFLLKEIMEQPESVTETLRGHLKPEEGTSHLGGVLLNDHEIRQIQRVLVLGCGTAYYAGLLGKYLLEKMIDIPVDVEVASEFRYREPVLSGNTTGVIISQSGETADTLASLKELKEKGVYTHGLVNTVGSSIAREVNGGMYLHVGPEISVASTKAFTSQVVGLLLFGLYIARKRTLPLSVGEDVVDALARLPAEIDRVLELNDRIRDIAQDLSNFDHALYMGRDTLYPIALEGALKLKEVSYLHAEGYSSGEMKHGPIALIDKEFLTVFLLGKGPLFEKSRTNLEEIHARDGRTLVVTDDEAYAIKDKNALFVETTSPWTAPLLFNIPLQLLAYHIATARGADVDQPRNLAKSVTVE